MAMFNEKSSNFNSNGLQPINQEMIDKGTEEANNSLGGFAVVSAIDYLQENGYHEQASNLIGDEL